jgi:hypothetical protein
MFDVFTAIGNFASEAISSVFGGGDPRNEREYSGGAREKELDLVEKYGGFLSGVGKAARTAMGSEEGYAPFATADDNLTAPRVQLGSSRAAQAPALGGIQSSRLNLAVQTAMRRRTQSNVDFQRLINQYMTQPRAGRGKRTMGIEPARLPSVQEIKPAEVRKEKA